MTLTVTSSPSLPHAECTPLALREELKQATRIEHDQLEGALDLMRPDFALHDYRELLARYHGFYQSFESFLKEQADPRCNTVRFYDASRRKLPWLQQDMLALNDTEIDAEAAAEMEARYRISHATLSALLPSASYLLGALYVIEGSMLGGMVLSRHFSRQLNLTADTGLRFFSGYGTETRSHWQALLRLLETSDTPMLERSEVVLGAKRMFSLLRRQLLQSVSA